MKNILPNYGVPLAGRLVFACICCLLGSTTLRAQATEPLARAQQLVNEKKLEEARAVLRDLHRGGGDVYSLRLHAQVAYWLQDGAEADSMYRKALSLYPADTDLALDYGRFLYQSGRAAESAEQLDRVLATRPNDAEALLMRAYIHRWQHRPAEARKLADKMLAAYPGNTDATALLQAIGEETAPWLQLTAGYLSDDQPLSGPRLQLDAGWYRSGMLAPFLNLEGRSISVNNQSYGTVSVLAGNTFRAGMRGPAITLGGGFIAHGSATDNLKPLYTVGLRQALGKMLHLDLQYRQRAYQYTVASAPILLMQRFAAAGIDLNHQDKWLGRAAFEQQQFDDKNIIKTAYAWAMAPLLTNDQWLLQAGYSFTWANSDSNSFRPKETLQQIIANWTPDRNIPGIYDPYFAPLNQTIHAVLASVRWKAAETATLQISGSYGFSATNDAPYFFLDARGPNGSELFLNGGQAPISYNPLELTVRGTFGGKGRGTWTPQYNLQQLFFYTSHYVSVGYRHRLGKQ